MPTSHTTSIANPFTQSWIQALTTAADIPVARTLKSKLEWIELLSTSRTDVAAEREAAAEQLWSFAESEGLQQLLWHLPVNHAGWVFDPDDIFTFEREPTSESQLGGFEAWLGALGLRESRFELIAEVTGSDWAGLVRKEAVRLQHSLDTTAVPPGANLTLPCTAIWDMRAWRVQFQQVDWIIRHYEDTPAIRRPVLSLLEEHCQQVLQAANSSLIAKSTELPRGSTEEQPWRGGAPALVPLHASILDRDSGYSSTLLRVWNCVWPVVYREINVLNGRADLGWIRSEIKACLTAQPRLTVWMFVFAKLVCQAHLGRGLGIIADFRDK